jgi:hypothetical protein
VPLKKATVFMQTRVVFAEVVPFLSNMACKTAPIVRTQAVVLVNVK